MTLRRSCRFRSLVPSFAVVVIAMAGVRLARAEPSPDSMPAVAAAASFDAPAVAESRTSIPNRHGLVSLATTGAVVAMASVAGTTNQADYWQVLHAGLIAGPATGYLTAGSPSDAWRGVAIRSAIAGGAAAAGAYRQRSRTGGIARREQTLLVVATAGMGISALWDIARLRDAERRAIATGAPGAVAPRPNTAFQISLAGTLAPAAIALGPREGGLAALGVIAGPATGYVYGRRTWRGLAGVGFRTLASALLVEISGDWLTGTDVHVTDDPVRRVAGSALIIGSAAYDLWRVRDAVRPRDTKVGVSLAPALLRDGSPVLAVAVRY